MMEKLIERKQRELKSVPSSGSPGGHRVSDKEFFMRAGNLVKVVNK